MFQLTSIEIGSTRVGFELPIQGGGARVTTQLGGCRGERKAEEGCVVERAGHIESAPSCRRMYSAKGSDSTK